MGLQQAIGARELRSSQITAMYDIPADSILRLMQVKAITGLKKSTIYNYGNPKSRFYQPTFPKRRNIGVRAVGWVASEIFQWVATRASA